MCDRFLFAFLPCTRNIVWRSGGPSRREAVAFAESLDDIPAQTDGLVPVGRRLHLVSPSIVAKADETDFVGLFDVRTMAGGYVCRRGDSASSPFAGDALDPTFDEAEKIPHMPCPVLVVPDSQQAPQVFVIVSEIGVGEQHAGCAVLSYTICMRPRLLAFARDRINHENVDLGDDELPISSSFIPTIGLAIVERFEFHTAAHGSPSKPCFVIVLFPYHSRHHGQRRQVHANHSMLPVAMNDIANMSVSRERRLPAGEKSARP